MYQFKGFIKEPVVALANGYEALLFDYWALWASALSFKNCKKLPSLWLELLTDYTLVELPVALLKAIISTLIFISLPLTFWIFGTVSYFTLPRAAIRYKKNKERAMRDL